MNYTKQKPKTKFVIRRFFARSRLEADYLAKLYEEIVPIYKKECLQQGNQQQNDIEEITAIYPEGIGA